MTTLTDTITLAAGELEASFAPERGMVATSLRHAGEELLDADAGRNGLIGIPLLHPWANRLSAHAYELDGHAVRLPPWLLHCEEHGLPIHGVLAGAPWEVVEAGRTSMRAWLDFGGELLEAFPFPHSLAITAALSPDRLTIATTILAGDPVPISFGFHPYLRLPGVPRERWHVTLPPRRELELDDRSIPTGSGTRRPSSVLRLRDRAFDDGYDGLAAGAEFRVAGGGRSIRVVLDAGYPAGQVYSPRGAEFICFEPMTAPTDALRSGAGLRRVRSFTATFSIRVDSL
jgi:galactose mutarotase-like enzyme